MSNVILCISPGSSHDQISEFEPTGRWRMTESKYNPDLLIEVRILKSWWWRWNNNCNKTMWIRDYNFSEVYMCESSTKKQHIRIC